MRIIWKIFEFLGDLVIYSSYQVTTTIRVKSYRRLCIYPVKDSSVWTEVWTWFLVLKGVVIEPKVRGLRDF